MGRRVLGREGLGATSFSAEVRRSEAIFFYHDPVQHGCNSTGFVLNLYPL